jgi:GTP-binding protein
MSEDFNYLISETSPQRLGPCAAEVTFVGRSNVGKSTLLNALCGKTLARVSNTPGRTQAINVFAASRDRWLVDLPGYGFVAGGPARSAGWGAMIESYLTGRPTLRMVFALVDAKVGPTRLDFQMIEWLQDKGLPWRSVATKTDQVKASHAVARRREVSQELGLKPEALFWVSAEKGSGVRELRAEMFALLGQRG